MRMTSTNQLGLFAGIRVTDYSAALRWYEALLGSPPTFFPHETEAVWELAEHRYLYITEQAGEAGRAVVLLFVSNLDTRVKQIADRGITPSEREELPDGNRKITYRDPDGNEVAFGGGPT